MSFPDVAQSHVIVPVKSLTTLEFPSLQTIREYTGPVLISHGDADEVVPFAHEEKLYKAVQGPKRFVRIPDGRHNDRLPSDYWETLDQFLSELDFGMVSVSQD